MNTNVDLEDQTILNQVVPGWARNLNAFYNTFFGPVNRFMSFFEKSYTNKIITNFEADESSRRARQARQQDPKFWH